MLIEARSIGERAYMIAGRPLVTGRVLASFARVCDLMTHGDEVLALAWAGVEDGPLNILLFDEPGVAFSAGARFRIEDGVLTIAAAGVTGAEDASADIGPLVINLNRAALWRSRPDWPALAAHCGQILARLDLLSALLAAEANAASLVHVSLEPAPGAPGAPPAQPASGRPPDAEPAPRSQDAITMAARAAIAAFAAAYAASDRAGLAAAAAGLCGLGPGLTPAGDDWLAGWLLSQHLCPRGPAGYWPDSAIQSVLAAATATTVLSRAFLRCAAAGEADAGWHRLLAALAHKPAPAVRAAVRHILSRGATSGADMLAGFLAGLRLAAARYPSTTPMERNDA